MPLIGPSAYHHIDLPADARPSPRLDHDTLGDMRAQRDAAAGWVAILLAHQHVGPDATGPERRDAEHHAAHQVLDRICSPHDADEHIDTARLIALRAQEVTS